MNPTKNSRVLLSLFLVLFIDGMGQGLFFPILSQALLNPVSQSLMLGSSVDSRNIVYSIIIASFFLAWFFGAPILSDLSDYAGRKKALLICLTGSALGYFLSALGFVLHNIPLILFGRIIDGFTAGSQPIAQAAIVDVSDPAKKTTNIALIMLSVSLGLIGGPIIGGALSNSAWISWFTITTPLYFAIFLAILNLVLLTFFFQETVKHTAKITFTFYRTLTTFTSAFTDRKVRRLSLIFLLLQSAWASVYTFLSVFLNHYYTLSNHDIMIVYAMLGLGLAVGFAMITRCLEGRVSKRIAVMFGYGLTGVALVILMLVQHMFYIWWLVLLAGATAAIGYSFLLALFSEAAGSEKQGWVMGITGAMNAVAFGFLPIIIGLFMSININIPYIIAIISIIFGCVFLAASKYQN